MGSFCHGDASLKNPVIDFHQQFYKKQEFGNETFNWVCLTTSFLCEINFAWLQNSIGLSPWIDFNWVWHFDRALLSTVCWYALLHACQFIPVFPEISWIQYTYLLLTQFEGHTVSYGPSFSPRFMTQARSARAINRRGKTRIRNLQYEPRKWG